jgi:hypothetical protein
VLSVLVWAAVVGSGDRLTDDGNQQAWLCAAATVALGLVIGRWWAALVPVLGIAGVVLYSTLAPADCAACRDDLSTMGKVLLPAGFAFAGVVAVLAGVAARAALDSLCETRRGHPVIDGD